MSAASVVNMLVCFFTSHTRPRVQRAPGVPYALAFEAHGSGTPRAQSRRGIADSCLFVAV